MIIIICENLIYAKTRNFANLFSIYNSLYDVIYAFIHHKEEMGEVGRGDFWNIYISVKIGRTSCIKYTYFIEGGGGGQARPKTYIYEPTWGKIFWYE